jgi:hypothetical protein
VNVLRIRCFANDSFINSFIFSVWKLIAFVFFSSLHPGKPTGVWREKSPLFATAGGNDEKFWNRAKNSLSLAHEYQSHRQ